MHKIYLYKAGLLLYGIGLITLGIIILFQGRFILSVAAAFGGAVLIAHGIHLFINIFFKGKKQVKPPPSLIAAIFNVLGGIVLLLMPDVSISTLIGLFVSYVFLNAFVKIVDYLLAVKNKTSGRFKELIAAVFFLTFGIITAFIPDMGMRSLLIVAGVYLIIYGAFQIYDFVLQLIPRQTKKAIKRRIRVSMPVFISTFMPLQFMRAIDKFFESDIFDKESIKDGYRENKDDTEPPDLEVLIHVSNHGVGKVGHCDLIYNGEILSYGNYDFDTAGFMRIHGEGVFFTAEKKRYVRFSVTHDKKTIICYGLRLTPEQLTRVTDEIKKLKESVYVWKPPFQLIYENDDGAAMAADTDYCSKLWEGTRACFYKFKEGRFKDYFVLSNNCALLMDSILGKAGTDIVRINGIITPGTYFDYLQGQFSIPGSMVISRTIYNRENTLDFKLSEDVLWEE